jgi:hypothetical protein
MKTRLIKNYITSIVGLLLLVLGAFMTYQGKLPWEAFMASLPAIFMLFRAKDSLLWAKAKEE